MDYIERAGLRAFDQPQDFADALVNALRDEQHAAAASRDAYDKLFSTHASFSSRDHAVKIAVAS